MHFTAVREGRRGQTPLTYVLPVHVVVEAEAVHSVGGSVGVFGGDAEHGADEPGPVALFPGTGRLDVHEEAWRKGRDAARGAGETLPRPGRGRLLATLLPLSTERARSRRPERSFPPHFLSPPPRMRM